jgi:hypothetical protein
VEEPEQWERIKEIVGTALERSLTSHGRGCSPSRGRAEGQLAPKATASGAILGKIRAMDATKLANHWNLLKSRRAEHLQYAF